MTLVGLAARNLLRNKVRTVLTVIGVAVAVVTFLLLRTVVAAWTAGADFAAKDRLVTRHKVTFVMPLPKRYVEQMRLDQDKLGIKSVTYANWFGGKDPAHDTEFFGTLAIDGKTYFESVPELIVTKEAYEAFMGDKTGAIVGDALAKKLGWTVGKTIQLDSGIYPSPDGGSWSFTVRGLYTATARNVDRSTFLFHWDYMNDAMPQIRKDQIGWIMCKVNDTSKTAEIGVAIDKMFDEKDIQTVTQDEHAFNASFLAGFSAILTAFDIVSVVILVIMMLVLGNTIAMGVRERTHEIATMRAIGFLPRHIALFILGEATVLGSLGGAVGILISYPFIQGGVGRFLEENVGQFFPFFKIPTSMTVLAFFLAVGLGVLASLLPARSAANMKVTDGLRRLA